MPQQKSLTQAKRELLSMKFDSGMEREILKSWREHQPKRIEELLTKGKLKQALIQMADALLDMQMDLEKSDRLPPALAKLEAWNILMRPTEDAKEEAAAWGMTVDEYLSRSWVLN